MLKKSRGIVFLDFLLSFGPVEGAGAGIISEEEGAAALVLTAAQEVTEAGVPGAIGRHARRVARHQTAAAHCHARGHQHQGVSHRTGEECQHWQRVAPALFGSYHILVHKVRQQHRNTDARQVPDQLGNNSIEKSSHSVVSVNRPNRREHGLIIFFFSDERSHHANCNHSEGI